MQLTHAQLEQAFKRTQLAALGWSFERAMDWAATRISITNLAKCMQAKREYALRRNWMLRYENKKDQ